MSLYLANDKYTGNLTQSYTVGDTTLYVDTVPTNVPTIVVVDAGGDNETVFTVTGKTSNSLTGVARLRGANVNIDNGTAITCLNNEDFINQYQSVGVEAWNDATDAATVTFDLSLSKKQRVVITDNRVLAVSGATPGMEFVISIQQDGTGSRTVTWWSGITWLMGSAPTLKTAINAYDVFRFIQIGTNTYLGWPEVSYDPTKTETLTNKRITKRVTTITSSGTPTINTDNCDVVTITAQAAAITSMTTNLSGTPTNFQSLIFRIKDDGTGRAITWGASFAAAGVDLPTTTTASKLLTVGFLYNTVTSKWECVASVEEA